MTPRRSTLVAALIALAAPAVVLAGEPPVERAVEPGSERGAAEAAGPAGAPALERAGASAAASPAGAGARPGWVVVAPPERTAARGVAISLSVKDADLVEVIRSLARIADLNLVVDPAVRGTVTAELENVRWDQALAVILKVNGLAMELDGRVITVAPPRRLYPAP